MIIGKLPTTEKSPRPHILLHVPFYVVVKKSACQWNNDSYRGGSSYPLAQLTPLSPSGGSRIFIGRRGGGGGNKRPLRINHTHCSEYLGRLVKNAQAFQTLFPKKRACGPLGLHVRGGGGGGHTFLYPFGKSTATLQYKYSALPFFLLLLYIALILRLSLLLLVSFYFLYFVLKEIFLYAWTLP